MRIYMVVVLIVLLIGLSGMHVANAQGDHGQAGYRKETQGPACGVDKCNSIQNMVDSMRHFTQGMLNKARTETAPAVCCSAYNVLNGVSTAISSFADSIKHIGNPKTTVRPDRSKPVIYDANLGSDSSRLGLISDPSLSLSERYDPATGQIYTISKAEARGR